MNELIEMLFNDAVLRYEELLTNTALKYARSTKFRAFYAENMGILTDETLLPVERNLKLSKLYAKRTNRDTSLLAVLLQTSDQTTQAHIERLAELFPGIKE